MTLLGSIDLFELLVNYTFGSVFLALLGWTIILLVTGIMGRMSFQSILIIIITYMATAFIGYLGFIAGLPALFWSMWYAISGIMNKMSEAR